jgi:uncharacterized membrane protein YcjF (UPF0283 family)
MTDPQDPTDLARTHQPRAGVAIKDNRGLVGYLLVGLAVLALAICLTAAALGNEAATIGAGAVAILIAALGSVWVFIERRRVARLSARLPADSARQGHAG